MASDDRRLCSGIMDYVQPAWALGHRLRSIRFAPTRTKERYRCRRLPASRLGATCATIPRATPATGSTRCGCPSVHNCPDSAICIRPNVSREEQR